MTGGILFRRSRGPEIIRRLFLAPASLLLTLAFAPASTGPVLSGEETEEIDPFLEEFEKLKAAFDAEKAKQPYERVLTIEKFGDFPTTGTVPFLEAILKQESDSPGIVGAVVRALGRIGTREAVTAIFQHGVKPILEDINLVSVSQALANPLEDEAEEWVIQNGLNDVVRKSPQAYKLMISAIASFRSERKAPLLQNELLKAGVPENKVAILRAIRDIRPREGAKVVHAFLRDQSVEVQVAVLEALQAMGAAAYGREYALFLKHPDWRVRALAVDLISMVSPPQILKQILPLLADPESRVRVGVIKALVARGGNEVIEPLIRALEKNEARVLDDVADALARLTGKDFGTNSAQWDSWWASSKGQVEIKRKPLSDMVKLKDSQPERLTGASTYFGLRVLSKNVAFIFDCSDSMTEPYEPPEIRKAREAAEAKSDGKSTAQNPQEKLSKKEAKEAARKAKEAAAKKAAERKKSLIPKLDVAKGELLKVVEHMPGDALANIIRFNSTVEPWQPALTQLNLEMKQDAKNYIQSSKPAGLTNLYAALEEAFKDEKLDTIYLLSDGAPTLGTVEPDDLLGAVDRLNNIRKVKINTIGFYLKPEERRLMEELAEKNYGVFLSR